MLLAALLTVTMFSTYEGASPLSWPSNGDDTRLGVQESYAQLPLAFQAYRGPASDRFDYLTHTQAGSVLIGAQGATLGLEETSQAIRLDLLNAAESKPQVIDRLPGVVNDFRGDDPDKWRSGIPTFGRVRYESTYPGIDIDWHGTQSALEYDFRLDAGADASQIAIRIAGADDVHLASSGDLLMDVGGRTIRQQAPVAYQSQSVDGGRSREPVAASFELAGETIGFNLGAYDRSRPLVIDPLVLAYSTYVGGTAGEGHDAGEIAVDSAGAAYIAGATASSDYPTVNPIPGQGHDGQFSPLDLYISKITPAGDALVYSTYLGGNSHDVPAGLDVDSNGALYVTGGTESTDFPGATINPNEGGNDAFVTKLTPAGAMSYSTHLGGSGSDTGTGIAVDSAGAAYVVGQTSSTDFDTVEPIEGDSGSTDIWAAKINPAGTALTYSTYIGGGGSDSNPDVAVDSAGAAYVTGNTTSADFDVVGGIPGEAASGGADIVILKVAPEGDELVYSTYLGGTGGELERGIAIDSGGNAYVVGETASTDFDTVNPIEGNENDNDFDLFVSKLNSSGNGLIYSTYLGGNDHDQARAIAVDSAGAAYITGYTDSLNLNVVNHLMGRQQGSLNAYVSKLTPAGNALGYSTYLAPPESSNGGYGIDVDSTGAAYVMGLTGADYPTTSNAYDDTHNGGGDAFISKLTFTASADSDGDGVPDASDDCPDQAGPQASNGCPDTIAPRTRITKTKIAHAKRKATFTFVSNEAGSKFKCKIDGKRYRACTSPKVYKDLKRGAHKFRVRAIDAAGNPDPTPAVKSFKINP